MKQFAALLLLLAGPVSSAFAVEPSAEPLPPAAGPTAWGCTTKTLISGEDCSFDAPVDAAPESGQHAAENARKAAALAKPVCDRAARPPGETRPDNTVHAICLKDFAEAAAHCDVGSEPLLDANGQFTWSARDCYRGLAEAVRRVATMAASSAKCCRCLARSGCAPSPEQCLRSMSRAAPEPGAERCLEGACSSACPIYRSKPSQDSELEVPEEENAERTPNPRPHRPLTSPSKPVLHL